MGSVADRLLEVGWRRRSSVVGFVRRFVRFDPLYPSLCAEQSSVLASDSKRVSAYHSDAASASITAAPKASSELVATIDLCEMGANPPRDPPFRVGVIVVSLPSIQT